MNNNHSLWTSLSFNSIDANNEDIVIDELFQILKVTIDNDDILHTTIYTPFNYSNVKIIPSHNVDLGRYYHVKNKEIIRFMLSTDKCKEIDVKHDQLRMKLF